MDLALKIMLPQVALACTDLSNRELNALYLSIQLGQNPKYVMGYEKIAHLFTEEDGVKMHDVTETAFRLIARNRLF